MGATTEMNHLFEAEPTGFVQGEGALGVQMKFENWISTPKGSFWGKPAWGHTLRKFLFDPPTETLASVIETELVATLGQDIPQVEIVYVRATPSNEDDCYKLRIGYRVPSEGISGEFQNTFSLRTT